MLFKQLFFAILCNASLLAQLTTNPSGPYEIEIGFGQSSDLEITVSNSGTAANELDLVFQDSSSRELTDAREALETQVQEILSLLPERYSFNEGENGNAISDGGGDMYDGGNRINFGSQNNTYLNYSNDTIETDIESGTSYFTRKYDGLFAFVADYGQNATFNITGDLGADGSGNIITSQFDTKLGYHAFVKSVVNAGDPSVNHLILVPNGPGLSQITPDNTNADNHIISGLQADGRLIYLLFAKPSGQSFSSETFENLAQKIASIFRTSPPWLDWDKDLAINPGQNIDLQIRLDGAGLEPGEYQTSFVAAEAGTDPDSIPTEEFENLRLTIAEPTFTASTNSISAGAILGSPIDPIRVDLTPISGNLDDLVIETDETWLNVNRVTGENAIIISPDSVGSTSAEITLISGDTRQLIEIRFLVSPLNLTQLLPDPLRPILYAINKSGTGQGSVIVIDTLTRSILKNIPVGLEPTDIALTGESAELLVMNTTSRSIQRIDLTSYEVTSTYELTDFSNRNNDFGGHVVDGPGNIVYYIDEQWGPRLRVFDTSTETVLQTFGSGSGQENNLSNDDGFGDIAISPDGQHLFGWAQYGDGAGSSGTFVVRFDIGADGRLSGHARGQNAASDIFRREPFDSPVLFSSDGTKLVIKGIEINQETLESAGRFPAPIYGMSPNGKILSSNNSFFPPWGIDPLGNLPSTSTVQTFLPDYSAFVSFANETLTWTDLLDTFNPEELGVAVLPADGLTTISPQSLGWLPANGASSFDVYLGSDLNSVTSAVPSSPEYLGESSQIEFTLAQTLAPGIYYWKIVPNNESPAQVYSFEVSTLQVSDTSLELRTLAGVNSLPGTITLNSTTALPWNATSSEPWLTLLAESGTTPENLRYSVDTRGLESGRHASEISLTADGQLITIPVTLVVDSANFTLAKADNNAPFIYLISQIDSNSDTPSYLARLDTQTDEIVSAINCGSSVTDFAIHYRENRIYVTNHLRGIVRAFDRNSLEEVQSYQLTIPGNFNDDDPYRIAAGRSGEIMIEGQDQWIDIVLIDTSDGSVIARNGERQGGGVFSPDGLTYYHGDSNSSGAVVSRHDMTDPNIAEVNSTRVAGFSGFGSRVITISGDGSRVFWNGGIFDSELNLLRTLEGKQVHTTTFRGEFAVTRSEVINTSNGETVASLPVETTIQAISREQDKLYLFEGDTVQIVDLTAITDLGPITLVPSSIPDNGVLIGTNQELSWSPDPSAISYQVYLGTDLARVTNAGLNDPELVGTPGLSFVPGGIDQLSLGQTYFWKVVPVGFNGPGDPSIWSFRISSADVVPREINLVRPEKTPILPVTLEIQGSSTWTASEDSSWISLDKTSGSAVDPLVVFFDTAGLIANEVHSTSITLTSDGDSAEIPVSLDLRPLNVTLAEGDLIAPVIYAISQPANNMEGSAYLVTIDSESGNILKATPCGDRVDDLAIHYLDDRIYLISQTEGNIRVFDRETTEELQVFDGIRIPDPNNPGTVNTQPIEGRRIAAGPAGQLMVESNSWPRVQLISTADATQIAFSNVSGGAGRFAPDNSIYYHGDQGSSGSVISKAPMSNVPDTGLEFDNFTRDADFNYYGSFNLRISGDGSLITWGGSLFDTDLNFLANYGDINPPASNRRGEVRTLSYFGDVASYDGAIINLKTGKTLAELPVITDVQAISADQDKIYLFQGSEIISFDLEALIDLPTAELTPTIPDGTTVYGLDQTLSWSPITSATSYHLFFGTDEGEINSATPASSSYLGLTSTPNFPGGAANLQSGQTYFWRVAYDSPGGFYPGRTFSFTVAPIDISPPFLEINLPAGASVPNQTISISAPEETNWRATPSSGVTISETSGSRDSELTLEFTSLPAGPGVYQETITFRIDGDSFDYNVTVNVFENNIVQMKPGITDHTVLALSSLPSVQGPSFLIEYDTNSRSIARFIEAGHAPLDFDFSPSDHKVFILSPDGNPSNVINSETWSHLPTLTLPDAGVTIETASNGRILVGLGERSNQVSVINSITSEILYSANLRRIEAPFSRPMAVSPGGSVLFAPNDSGTFASFDIGDNQLTQIDTFENVRYEDSFLGKILITESGNAVFFQDYRTTSSLQARLNFRDRFQPVAIDRNGLVAIGREEIFFARSGQKIGDLPFASDFAAIPANDAALVRFNPETRRLESTPMSDYLTLPGPIPQPNEEFYDGLTNFSINPVQDADSYELFWGVVEDDLNLSESGPAPSFAAGDNLPDYANIFWKIDAIRSGVRVSGTVNRAAILPVQQEAQLTRTLTKLRLSDGMLTGGYSGSFSTGTVFSHRGTEDLPGKLEDSASLPNTSNNFPQNALGHAFAGGKLFTNRQNSIVGYEQTPFGSYREVSEFSIGTSPQHQLRDMVGSGDLLFVSSDNQDSPTLPTEVQIFRTYPDLVLEQTIRAASNTPTYQGFASAVVAAGNLLVVSNVQSFSADSLKLWIYRRGNFPTNPWRFADQVTINSQPFNNAMIDTDGESILVSYTDQNTGQHKISVIAETGRNHFSETWSAFVGDYFDTISSNPAPMDIAIDQDFLVMSTRNTTTRLDHRSSVAVLRRRGNSWVDHPLISASATNDFGEQLELTEGILYVGDNARLYRYDLFPSANEYPRILSAPPFQAAAGQAYEAAIEVTDDSDSFQVEPVVIPSWMRLEENDGHFMLSGTALNASNYSTPIRFRVTDSDGASTYRTFTLSNVSPNALPELSQLPESIARGSGQQLKLKPETSGIGPFSWQWYFSGEPIEGATSAQFSITNLTETDTGVYSLKATNVVGTTTSNDFELTVEPANRFAGDWTTFGAGPGHLGHHSATLGTHTFLPAWTARAHPDRPLQRTVIAEEKVFVVPQIRFNGAQQVKAFDLTDGQEIWSQSFDEANSMNPPTYHNGRIYFQRGNHSSDSQLWALNAGTGATLWSAPFRAQWERYEAPTVTEEGIWANGGSYGGLYGFNHDGTEKFFQGLAQVDGWTPAVRDGIAYTWVSGTFSAHDSESGAIIWSITPSDEDGFTRNSTGTPVLTSKEAILRASDQTILCVDLESNSIRWRTPQANNDTPDNRRFTNVPAMFGDTIFGIAGNLVVALDLETGTEKFTFDAGETITSGQPLILNDHLFVSSSSETKIFNLETRELSQTLPVGGLLSYSNAYLSVAGTGGEVYSYFANDIPDVGIEALPAMVENNPYSVDLNILHDDDNEELTITLRNAPDFLTVNDNGKLSGQFNEDAVVLEYNIEIEVSDGVNAPVIRQLTLNLINVNDPPVINPFFVDLIEDGDPFSIALDQIVSDEETELENLDIQIGPANVELEDPISQFTVENGIISITPLADRFGTIDGRLQVTDPDGGSSDLFIPVTIAPVPDPPRLDEPFADLASNEAADAITLNLSPQFFDPDPGENLTFSVTGNTNPEIFSNLVIQDSTLRIDFVSYQAGSSDITVTATDPGGLTLSDTFTVTLPPPPPLPLYSLIPKLFSIIAPDFTSKESPSRITQPAP
ncbi:PQQ-binding-like beta-propeller repeat protein [bacterium]|nr:PQQ-binding-like beta-propeller repeat protein [bacterium]